MSNAIAWLDRDEGPVNYGEPTYWEKRCECHDVMIYMSKSFMSQTSSTLVLQRNEVRQHWHYYCTCCEYFVLMIVRLQRK